MAHPPHPDAALQRCLARKRTDGEPFRPHVCIEQPDHGADELPHRCTCGFTWWW